MQIRVNGFLGSKFCSGDPYLLYGQCSASVHRQCLYLCLWIPEATIQNLELSLQIRVKDFLGANFALEVHACCMVNAQHQYIANASTSASGSQKLQFRIWSLACKSASKSFWDQPTRPPDQPPDQPTDHPTGAPARPPSLQEPPGGAPGSEKSTGRSEKSMSVGPAAGEQG